VSATNKPLTSHDYARGLQAMAEYLLARDAFNVGSYGHGHHYFRMSEKEPFVSAVKALGNGKKNFTEDEINFRVELPYGTISVDAPRNVVCRLIRAAEYECDPLLSPEEEKKLGGDA
jgi:hypothetical protein